MHYFPLSRGPDLGKAVVFSYSPSEKTTVTSDLSCMYHARIRSKRFPQKKKNQPKPRSTAVSPVHRISHLPSSCNLLTYYMARSVLFARQAWASIDGASVDRQASIQNLFQTEPPLKQEAFIICRDLHFHLVQNTHLISPDLKKH